ncbi:hypothetical protein AB0F44_06330 [Nocardioides sp. NPDC023903]|uniref:hypothetical protein n=1 Tax=Nocardioides sp. NPDC023903 TaxID=3157195 RepID=UPI0033F23217
MDLRARAAMLAVLAFLAAGCADLPRGAGPSPAASHPPYDPTPADFEAVEDLLAQRAEAALEGDEAAFLATVDPATGSSSTSSRRSSPTSSSFR